MPFILARLLWRSRRLPAYRERIRERFGFYSTRTPGQSIWVHAVSVGEAIAAAPLIKALKTRYPSMSIVVTTMTPTGAERVKALLGDSVTHLYVPYDLPGSVNRFLKTINPVISIIIETELWPNMFHACHIRHIPICLTNARLSEKSAKGYQRIAPLTRTMLQQLTVIAAHAQKDAERFIALGAPAERVITTGNIKFDLVLPADLPEKGKALRHALGKDRFVWVAASTHEGEEEVMLAAHRLLQEKQPEALLVLVPRHPDRFDHVVKLCEQSFTVERRTQTTTCSKNTSVYVGDTMGELLLLYSAGDVAFVGGSLIPVGGHNILEPGALGKPVLTGNYLFNFKEISELFLSADAMVRIQDAKTLAEQLSLLSQAPTESAERGKRAKQVVESNRGALAKQLDIIATYLSS